MKGSLHAAKCNVVSPEASGEKTRRIGCLAVGSDRGCSCQIGLVRGSVIFCCTYRGNEMGIAEEFSFERGDPEKVEMGENYVM